MKTGPAVLVRHRPRNPAVDAAINSIPEERFFPVRLPGAMEDHDTGELICDAQVPEVEYTVFAESGVSQFRRVRLVNPVWLR